MKVAIFADIHGRILLPFKLVDLYQKETGEKINLILQCGDMGCFPDLDYLDKATIRHAKYDRDELGFHDDFTEEKKEIKDFLNELNLKMICVRGNHEDHEFLDEIENEIPEENLFPVDIYERVWVCKSGREQIFKTEDEELSFIGIGRIGDRKGRKDPKFIQDYEKDEIKKLIRRGKDFDVLITHDKSAESIRGYGMQEIRNLLDNIIFDYHFFGHTGESFYEELDDNNITTSIKIKELEFNRDGILPYGCMIILEKNEDRISYKIVDEKITNQLAKHNWKY